MRRLLVLLLVLAATGCAGDDEPAPGLPDGVTVTVDQARSDLATRRVLVRVDNDGSRPLTVHKAALILPGWDGEARYDGPATIAARAAVNLPVEASAPDTEDEACGDVAAARVRLLLERPDGGTVEVTVPVRDRFGAVGRLVRRDCVDASLRVDVGLPQVEGREIVLPLVLVATEAAVDLESIGGTVLLDLAPGEDGRLDRRLEAGDRWARDVRLVPARCDAHVVAEDKVGTLLPLRVVTEHGEATTFVRLPGLEKGRVLDQVVRLCGIGRGDDPLLDD